MHALSTGGDEGVEGDCVWNAALLVHFIEQLQCQLPLPSLLTSADETAVCDDAAFAAFPDHLLEDLHDLPRAPHDEVIVDIYEAINSMLALLTPRVIMRLDRMHQHGNGTEALQALAVHACMHA